MYQFLKPGFVKRGI